MVFVYQHDSSQFFLLPFALCSVPSVVVRCVDYLRQRAMHVSGIFRVNVAKTDIMAAWKKLEADGRFSCAVESFNNNNFMMFCLAHNNHNSCTSHEIPCSRHDITFVFDTDDADLSDVSDPHLVAGLLKLYLRKQTETPLNFSKVASKMSRHYCPNKCISTACYRRCILTVSYWT